MSIFGRSGEGLSFRLRLSIMLLFASALMAAMDHSSGGGGAGHGTGKAKHFRETAVSVALEAEGYAEDVATFHELENKLSDEHCKLTGPCAWQLSFTPTDVSVIAPEPHVIYHYSIFTMFENDTAVYRVRGQFPKVRYFSIQTYTIQRQPIDVLTDYQIKPVSGINPYVTHPPGYDHNSNGFFEAYVTANGNQGYPNELKAYHPDRLLSRLHGQNSSYNLFLLAIRYYASDPSNDQTVPWGKGPSLFGFVPAPTVEWKRHDKPFKMIPQCTPGQEQCNTNILDRIQSFPQFLLPLRDIPGFICPLAEKDHINSDFYLWRTRLPEILDLYIGYKNTDVTYMYWCDIANRMGRDFVLKITGTLASTPKGLYEDPLISQPDAYEARYVSFHAVDLRPPIPSYSAIYDGEMWQHYGQGWDRKYSIVSSVDREIAEACGLLDDKKDIFLPYSRSDGNMSSRVVATPGIIYREILPSIIQLGRPGKSPTDVALRCGMDDEEATGNDNSYWSLWNPSTWGDTKRRVRHPECEDPNFSRSVMQERYPEITVYHCNPKTGVATVLA